ncbi:unnamed protein product, partial [Cyprideis torosa]
MQTKQRKVEAAVRTPAVQETLSFHNEGPVYSYKNDTAKPKFHLNTGKNEHELQWHMTWYFFGCQKGDVSR